VDVTRAEVDAAVAEGRLTEDMWNIEKAAAFLGLKVGTLYQWRHNNKGPRSYKVGGKVVYDPAELRAYRLASASEAAA
jgi:predicted DNA-binding transcriptional regulator AlpA